MESQNLQGKILEIYETNKRSEKFQKREFVVEVNTSGATGTYLEPIKLQLTQERCDMLNHVEKGDMVGVRFNIRGNKWKDKDNKTVYFTNNEATEINVVSRRDGTGSNDTIDDQFPLEEPEEELLFKNVKADSIIDPDEEPDDLPFRVGLLVIP